MPPKLKGASAKEKELLPKVYKKADDIKAKDLVEIYHLSDDVCGENKRKIQCKLNPNCFLGLGESKLGEAIKAQINNEDGVGFYLREPNTYVGLKNLGATCYMNTLLQSLFMNKTFRQGVYDWEEDQKDPNAICYQLQLLFGFLQEGKKKFYDPTPFANEINIKTGEQQDAQEFYKIFISYLEEEFKKSPVPRVNNLIEQQFQGKSQYITICQNCKVESVRDSSFYELELGIDDILTVGESIERYLGQEELTGSNQYFCEPCNSKQDAARSIALIELPEVLSLQILRFYYDIQSGSKKKKSNSIYFPVNLNMKPFMRNPNLPDEEYIYELTSMAIHKGNSAYGGHYVADIRDEETNKWYRFDDEVVEEIELNLEASAEDQKKKDEKSKSSPKSPTKKKGGKKTKKEKEVDEDSKSGAEPLSKNGKNNYNNNNTNLVDITEEKDIDGVKDGFISSDKAYFLTYTKKGRKTVDKPTVPEDLKAIIELQSNEFALEAEEDISKRNNTKKLKDTHAELFEQIWPSIAVDDPSLSSKCCWIHVDWLKSWIKGECEVNEKPIDNIPLACAHGKLDPRKLSVAKRITPKAWEVLHERYKGGPKLTEESYCKQCILDMSNNVLSIEDKEKTKQEVIDMIVNGETKNGYWISGESIKEFKKAKVDKQVEYVINHDLRCPHGGLTTATEKTRKIISAEAWSYITSIYPNVIELSSVEHTDNCVICEDEAEDDKKRLKKETSKRDKLKKELPILYRSTPAIDEKDETLRPKRIVLPLTADDAKIGEKYFIVPLHWAEKWKYYISHPKETQGMEFPEGPDNSPFLCEHGKFMYAMGDYIENATNTSIMLVLGEEWDALLATYGGGPAVTTASDVCDTCRNRRLLEWSDGAVYVTRITKTQSAPVVSTQSRSRGRKKIERLNSKDTVQKLKMLICEAMDLLPSEQELHYNDVILSDPKLTLAEYGVKNESLIQLLKVDAAINDDIAMRDNAREEGFVGSTLLGGKRKRDENSREEVPRSSEPATWICSTCTLHNKEEETRCEACSAVKPPSNDSSKKRSRSNSSVSDASEEEQPLMKRQRIDLNGNNNHNNHGGDTMQEEMDVDANLHPKPPGFLSRLGSLAKNFLGQGDNNNEDIDLNQPVDKPIPEIKILDPNSKNVTDKKLNRSGDSMKENGSNGANGSKDHNDNNNGATEELFDIDEPLHKPKSTSRSK